MFGNSRRPVAFDPYPRRRSGARLPRWLVLLLVGLLLGAGGLYLAQQRYLPPRLSVQESTALRNAFDSAEAARLRLAAELGVTTKRLEAALAEAKRATDELTASRDSVAALRADLRAVVATLPADPRGGAVQVRAARFSTQSATQGTTLGYDLLLTRERSAGKPLAVALRFVIAGDSARGAPLTFTAPSEAASVGSEQLLRGSVALPEGLRPREVTVQVLDAAGGKPLGMRVLRVN